MFTLINSVFVMLRVWL